VAAPLDAPVIGVRRHEDGERLGRAFEEGRHLRPHCRAVVLEREEVVAALRQHLRRGLALRVQGVAGHQQAAERQRPEQRPGREDLVLAFGDGLLPDRHPCAGPEGGDQVQGRAAGGAVERPAQGLAVDRQHPGPLGPEVVEERLEGAAERLRIEQPEDAAERVVARQAILQAKNSRKSTSRSSANSAKSTQLSAPQTDATSAIVRMSSKSCRWALPRRGSGISPRMSINNAIGPSFGANGRIQISLKRKPYSSNAIPLRAGVRA
jgi:hypothetical protein